VRFGDDRINPRYAFYYLGHPIVREWISRHAIGATLPNLNTSILSALPFLVPPFRDQAAIAKILGALDDKIELNRRMNETLEAMARAIFKSWFVDFLPVRAKMAAKAQDPMLLLPQAEQGTWYVYAIECNDGSLYIGQTEDLRQRWLQHIGGKGSDWTKRHPPVRVPYWEKQPSREAAVERERWLKTGFGRKWLKREIAARTQTGDPVRAKAAGRQPSGMDAATALSACDAQAGALFPDSFVDSPLGIIPTGWGTAKLDAICELAYGKALREDVRNVGTIPVFGSNGQVGWHNEPLVKGPGVVVGRKGNPGFVTWARRLFRDRHHLLCCLSIPFWRNALFISPALPFGFANPLRRLRRPRPQSHHSLHDRRFSPTV
jgi:predicted GIY-YIG superfamily endonuclease